MDWDEAYRSLSKRNWIILLVLSTASYFLMSHTLTLGIILGGLAIIFNFNVLQHTIRRTFPSGGIFKTRKALLIAKSYFRLLALGAVIYFLLKFGWVNPIGLVIGLSIVVFSIISFGISRAIKTTIGEAA